MRGNALHLLLLLIQTANSNMPSTPKNKLGWFPMIMGHISLHWRAVQHAYYVSLGKQNTGKQWAIQLIIQFFNVSWDMWEHRNGITHGSNSPAQRRRAAALNAQIHSEYSLGSKRLLPRD